MSTLSAYSFSRFAFVVNRDPWAWEQPECQEQILELRRALRHPAFSRLHKIRQCQILTNLANQLSSIGRFIEAVEIFGRALSLSGKFGMARGNRGIALSHYAAARVGISPR